MILLKIIDAFMENSMGEVMAEYLDLFYNFIDFNNIFKKQMGLAPFNTQENSKLRIDENFMLSKEWVAHVKDSPSLANEKGLLQVVSSFYVLSINFITLFKAAFALFNMTSLPNASWGLAGSMVRVV